MNFILNIKLKYYTKEVLKYFNIAIIALGFIVAIILIKYEPIYKVSISGEELGYIKNKEDFEENIKATVIKNEEKNIDNIELVENPEYELKLVNRTLKNNETEVAEKMQENLKITYKYYEIALNNKTVNSVNTLEEAEQLVTNVNENKNEELGLSIVEKYTDNKEEVKTESLEVAEAKVKIAMNDEKKVIEEQKRYDSLPEIKGIKLAVTPLSGRITSRFGESSRIRSSRHKGLDIAAPTGTSIQAIADGKVILAQRSGAFGNLVKIDHGNGFETWYAHTSKMYVKAGQQVKAGDTIAAVGSTGNSTGPHLHLEIRIDGQYVNPQNYLYK